MTDRRVIPTVVERSWPIVANEVGFWATLVESIEATHLGRRAN